MNIESTSTHSIDVAHMSFIDLQNQEGKHIEVVDWCWSGSKDPDTKELHLVCSYFLALYEGRMVYLEGGVKQTYDGPANKFKGFIYTQVMKTGVQFRNLFKNLKVELHEGDIDLDSTEEGEHNAHV